MSYGLEKTGTLDVENVQGASLERHVSHVWRDDKCETHYPRFAVKLQFEGQETTKYLK